MRKTAVSQAHSSESPAGEIVSRIDITVGTWESWIVWSIAGLYTVLMAYLTFRYHTIGGFGVETDFYAELAQQAKQLLGGQLSPHNYGLKGPVYSFILAGVYLAVRDMFNAGLVINLTSGFFFLVFTYYIIRRIFNRLTALLTMLAITMNYSFMTYTYQAGSDMLFIALGASSIYFLFRSEGRSWKMIALSAVLGLLTFLTRYNGAYIVMGTAVFFLLSEGAIKERAKRFGIWLGVFIIVGLPWFIPNYVTRGNPVFNDNYLNVMIEFYGINSDGFSSESWYDDLPRQFTGLGDVILHDPVYFTTHFLHNIVRHFVGDMHALIGFRLGFFVLLGIIWLPFRRPLRMKLAYLSFGLFYFLILCLVFYNDRFSLLMTGMYFPLAYWPFTAPWTARRLKRWAWMPLAVLLAVTVSSGYTSTGKMLPEIKEMPPVLTHLKNLGIALGRIEPDKSQSVISRKPHTAHYAGLNPLMFPDGISTVRDLADWCRENKVRYVLYSVVELKFRPDMRVLSYPETGHEGLELILANESGFIYRVDGI